MASHTRNIIRSIVKEICKQKGITIAQLAKAIGVESIYLYAVLRGSKISRPTILKLAEHLHIPHLVYEYEKQLRSADAGKQSKKSTSNKESETQLEVRKGEKGLPAQEQKLSGGSRHEVTTKRS